MKIKIGAYLMVLAVIMMSLSACGGGSNSSTPVVMTSLNNPVLVNYSTTVYANFSNYTSSVKFGSPITFTVAPDVASFSHVTPNSATFSHFSSITSRIVKTDVGGMAWVTLKSPLPGRFIVKATSNGTSSLGGQTSISFIVQPAAIEVRVGMTNRLPLTNVGRLDFDLVSSLPAPVFDNFSGIQSPLLLAEDTTPLLPGIPDGGVTNLHVTSLQGITITGFTQAKGFIPLFLFHYVPTEPSAPNFNLANISCEAADTNATPLSANLFIISTKYFDSAGNLLFH
jgi:hypothetical protein